MIAPSPRDSSRRLRGVRPRVPPSRHAPRPPWRRRAAPSRLPSVAAAAVIALHALAYPAAEAGVRLLAPRVEARERNRQALVAVSQLVSSMFYGDDGDLLAWQRSLEAVSRGDLGEAVRSQARTQAMADSLLAQLGDPYSGYASQARRGGGA
ncbi:hypothetical protein AB1Y20_005845 [Prymnesium parvum]|uniref:Uncharacterized protein n=1 Tax=Prymnesium parvum TaxID=97485 RepID=A0AB34J0J8_PRYPA